MRRMKQTSWHKHSYAVVAEYGGTLTGTPRIYDTCVSKAIRKVCVKAERTGRS